MIYFSIDFIPNKQFSFTKNKLLKNLYLKEILNDHQFYTFGTIKYPNFIIIKMGFQISIFNIKFWILVLRIYKLQW